MTYKASNKAALLGCAAMLFLFVGSAFLYFSGGAYTETFPRPFDSKSWISARNFEDDRRCGMLADLRLRVKLEGKTPNQVIALLGEPEDRRYEPDVSYWLLCPSFLDTWVLGVRWKNGRAVEVFVHDT